jgi:hypothetical protein
MTTAAQVRDYFKHMGESSPGACAKALGAPWRDVYSRIRDLVKNGWLIKDETGYGIYRFHQLKDSEHGQCAKLQEKMWRAARLAKSFTVWDIALYSHATLDYTKKYVTFLKRQGHVTQVGKKGQRVIYQCTATAKTETPICRKGKKVLTEVKRQDLLDLGLDMVRAIKDGDHVKAAGLHAEIGKGLNKNKRQ